ncbi:MAG: TlpA family protein disulfide reductase [Candidatus Rokubacteria bacterium]|nr:TlpA family protein disulfide reductase [Candidatus Rokubacteria bacterium]
MIVGALTLLLGALAGPASARDPAFSAMAVTHDPREDEAPDFTLATPLVAKFMSDFRLSFPAPIDPGSRVAALYRVPGVPTTFLIDRRGRMLGVAVGPREWATPEGRTLIRGLLDRR